MDPLSLARPPVSARPFARTPRLLPQPTRDLAVPRHGPPWDPRYSAGATVPYRTPHRPKRITQHIVLKSLFAKFTGPNQSWHAGCPVGVVKPT